MGLGPFGASAPLFLRNGELHGHSPILKNPTGRRSSVREFITKQTCKICDYTVDYMCPTKTSKSPHAFAMCSIRTDLVKQENEKIDSL